MVSAPALPAIGADVLWCLGLGLLVAAGRDVLGLCFGNGKALCFAWDLLAFACAAMLLCGFAAQLSASGVARWYMAAGLCGGVLGWRWGVSAALHRALQALLWCLTQPLRLVSHCVLRPLRRKLGTVFASTGKKIRRKFAKKTKNEKKVLQKQGKILYN